MCSNNAWFDCDLFRCIVSSIPSLPSEHVPSIPSRSALPFRRVLRLLPFCPVPSVPSVPSTTKFTNCVSYMRRDQPPSSVALCFASYKYPHPKQLATELSGYVAYRNILQVGERGNLTGNRILDEAHRQVGRNLCAWTAKSCSVPWRRTPLTSVALLSVW